VITRCLARNPEHRPRSAREVAAALPGGDPLAAALAAGETPSPELVAAAGGAGRLTRRMGIALLVVIALSLALTAIAERRMRIIEIVKPELPPAALEHRAREICKELGASVEGRAIRAARIPSTGVGGRSVLVCAGIHGVEFIGTEVALGFLEAAAAGEAAVARLRQEFPRPGQSASETQGPFGASRQLGPTVHTVSGPPGPSQS